MTAIESDNGQLTQRGSQDVLTSTRLATLG